MKNSCQEYNNSGSGRWSFRSEIRLIGVEEVGESTEALSVRLCGPEAPFLAPLLAPTYFLLRYVSAYVIESDSEAKHFNLILMISYLRRCSSISLLIQFLPALALAQESNFDNN